MYGVRNMGEEVSSRRVGGRMKDRIVLSALEVKMVVPSGDLAIVRIYSGRAFDHSPLCSFEVINL